MTKYFTKDGDEYKKVDETLLTQAEIDTDIIPKRLERERKKFADYDELKEKSGKVDTISKEFEDKLKAAGDEKSAVEKERESAKLETVKVKAIHEFKLSENLSEFINGEDEKTIREQAEKLSKGVGGSSVKIDKAPKPGEKTSDTKKVAKSLFGPSNSDD